MNTTIAHTVPRYPKWFGRAPRHIFFWLVYYLYDGPIASSLELVPYKRMITAGIALPLKVAATYFTLYLITNVYKDHRGPLRFSLLMIISILTFGVLQRIVSVKISYTYFYPDGLNHPLLYAPKIVMEVFGVYSVVAIAATLHFIKQWYIGQQQQQQFKNEKLQAELKYLKAQVHPHFLFNTLNNLYALTINDPKKAPEVVFRLSGLMSYMLYDSNKDLVPLEKEIRYIVDYITLERIRYDDRLDVSLNVHTDVADYTVAPLIILPFVENSFKHGCSNELGNVWVHIDVLVNEGQLIFKIENSKSSLEMNGSTVMGGLGLQNVRKRLELIYKEEYDLQIYSEDSWLVVLKLPVTLKTSADEVPHHR